MAKLVYIGGYGHSGSTLLEALLASNPSVLACGEIASAARQRIKKTPCTCGAQVQNCPVWGPFSLAASDRKWRHSDLTMALLEGAADNYAAMVDSSKTAWHSGTAPFWLRRKLRENFLLVHLVRDPRAVCWSVLRKAERQGNPNSKAWRCVSSTLGWLVANFACKLFGWRYPSQYVRIRYEDLVGSPQENVDAILRSILPEDRHALLAASPASNRHQLYGNRMRSQVPSRDEIREDRVWQAEMPRGYKALVGALSWPLYP